jgi:hypothetical protein
VEFGEEFGELNEAYLTLPSMINLKQKEQQLADPSHLFSFARPFHEQQT